MYYVLCIIGDVKRFEVWGMWYEEELFRLPSLGGLGVG